MSRPIFKDPLASESAFTSKKGPIRACLLVNPVGGSVARDRGQQVAQIWTMLRAAGIWAEIVETKPDEPPHLVARKAAEEGFSMVVACGGDGTVGAVAKGLVGTECPLGILPLGTYNNFARSLQLPSALKAACRVLARGRVRRVDVGLANNEHYFFEAAGVGIDAQLFPLGEEIKSGNWLRLWQVVRLAYQAAPAHIHFELDLPLARAYKDEGTTHNGNQEVYVRERRSLDVSALMLIVANGRYYGSGFTVAPDALLDDGKFNVRVFRNFSKGQLLKHFWSISRGRYAHSSSIDTFFANEINVTADVDLPFHVDGHQVGRLPLRLESLRRALKVIV